MDPNTLRSGLAQSAGQLWAELSSLAEGWVAPVFYRLDRMKERWAFPKTVNDPVWGAIELYAWEVLLLDSPLMQRLRGVRQLGMAHLVYPGAGHDRLEHSLGVVEGAERIMCALARNASHRQRFGPDADESIPNPSNEDKVATRLAALLHDIGHGPFSHASEGLIAERHAEAFERVGDFLRKSFAGTGKVNPGESVAVLLVMSEPMQRVWEHKNFDVCNDRTTLAARIAARILGSRDWLTAPYLSGVISGPLDADKLDYMARDSDRAGLAVGLDMGRLISKLEVVTVTPENAPNDDLRQRAEDSPKKRFYEVGLSLAGMGAFEQMVIGRVMLFDRMYYHHKVRAAEAMARKLVQLAETEGKRTLTLAELFHEVSDETMIDLLGGHVRSDRVPSGGPRAAGVRAALKGRDLHKRAFAFAARFIAGLDGLSDQEQKDTKALLWDRPHGELTRRTECDRVADLIFEKARLCGDRIPELAEAARQLCPEHVLVDLPREKGKVGAEASEIILRTPSGHLARPNLYFNPDIWSEAYAKQKQCGFVFTPKQFVPLVALASRLVFHELYDVTMTPAADLAAKTTDVLGKGWIDTVHAAGLCTLECKLALTTEKPRLALMRENHVRLPDHWRNDDPELAKRLAEGFRKALPTGLVSSMHKTVVDIIEHLVTFIEVIESGGNFVGRKSLLEKELQAALLSHLRSRNEQRATEGSEVGGGETDVVIDRVVIENKVGRVKMADPLMAASDPIWQARRYAISLASRVAFVVLAYEPADENAILPMTSRIAVSRVKNGPQDIAQVRVVIPWGQSVPSRAKAPAATS